MPTHAHFEELCVLATSGQLSPAESDVLNQHLVECDNCHSFLKEAHFVSDRVIPQVLHASRTETRVPTGLRERFLARAASQGLKINAGPPVAFPSPAPEPNLVHQIVPTPAKRFALMNGILGSLRPSQIVAIAGAACAVCFVLGLAVGTQYVPQRFGGSDKSSILQPAAQKVTANVSGVNTNVERVTGLTAERDQLTKQVSDLTSQLQTVETEKQQIDSRLNEQIAAAKSNDHDSLVQQLNALGAKAADLESRLDAVRQSQSIADADLRTARAKTSEYAARLDLLQTQLHNQETAPLPNPGEVSSLVAARNLHIIDVYDSNAKGQRRRAFGRVFYVEGRSLVFYAYDLSTAHAQKNITFHLWGEKAGSKETTLSLGVLHDDDPQERRWVLTCNDPNLLAKINSVYVTAESPGKRNDSPHGPRVLYAYFGAPPNHP